MVFKDLFDFRKRVDKRQVNRRTIESLIRLVRWICLGKIVPCC
jgi:DNA polymerase-3 subunit alpha